MSILGKWLLNKGGLLIEVGVVSALRLPRYAMYLILSDNQKVEMLLPVTVEPQDRKPLY